MQVETVAQFIHWTQKYHLEFAQCLRHCASQAEAEMSAMLLNYLARHESELADILDAYLHADFDNGLNSWVYEYFQKSPLVQHNPSCESQYVHLDDAAIMARYVDQNNQVIDFYTALAQRASQTHAHALLETLTEIQKQHLRQVVQSANRMRDI